MRELHGYHGEHRHHARHAENAHHGRDATAEAHINRAIDAPVRDSPDRAAQDALKLRMLTDPAFRTAERLKYQRKEEAAYADYAAKHAKPGDRAGDRTNEQTSARNADREDNGDRGDRPGPPWGPAPRPEHAPPESRDKPASKIAERLEPANVQKDEQPKPHRSRLPKTDTVQMVAGNGLAIAITAVALGVFPDSWEKVTAGIAAAVINNVAWANRRWKEKHGNRPED